ncbi:scopoletin 8-hydroxylase-like [Vicia villosa]|uniref:scopoletin 8-hydroxylase-like n=1 Tax=Vicia villosa TaxID=3911 RepID=UPI00273AE0FE|nr:scopoletin 8-hydroxylase-like [Vicia villosa]
MAQISNSSDSLYNFVVKDGNGIKGLVDSGLSEVPKIYIQPINNRINKLNSKPCEIQPIDLSKLNGPEHEKVVDEIVRAAETLGFFQVVNHCVPPELLESLKDSAHSFFNLPPEEKVIYRNSASNTRYKTSFVPELEKVLEWKDYINMVYSCDEDALQHWPNICKEVALEYLKLSSKIARDLLKILIDKLGVKLDDSKMESLIGTKMVNMNYYPACPYPELTAGTVRHSDSGTITILLQDGIGGLHVKSEDESNDEKEVWLEIPPIQEALVINVGDALEVLSNGKYKSAEHRVLTTSTQSRVSVPMFSLPMFTERIGPFPELVKKDGFAGYRDVLWQDYMDNYFRSSHDGKKTLEFATINST